MPPPAGQGLRCKIKRILSFAPASPSGSHPTSSDKTGVLRAWCSASLKSRVDPVYGFSALLNRPGRPSHPIIPYPTGRFFRGTLFQALRARLRSVSSLRDAMADISQQHHLAKACCELSRRDGAIVAWHEMPGKTPPKEPSRRVRCDRVRRTRAKRIGTGR
jgi:hypothetical protein